MFNSCPPIWDHGFILQKSIGQDQLAHKCSLILLCTLPHTSTVGWLVVFGFNATFNSEGHIMAVSDKHVFPGFLTSTNTTFFPKPPTIFLACFDRGETQKYSGKNVCLNRVAKSQPPGHESDTFTTELAEWGYTSTETIFISSAIDYLSDMHQRW